jgi:hypothetical protein
MTDDNGKTPERLPPEVVGYSDEDVEAVAEAMYEATLPSSESNQWILDSDDVRDLFRGRARAMLESGIVVSSGQVRRLSKFLMDQVDFPLDDFDDLANRMLASVADRILELLPEKQ